MILISAITREDSIGQSDFLMIFSILGLIYLGFYTIQSFTSIGILVFLLNMIFSGILLMGYVFFSIYAIMNKEEYGIQISIGVILLLIGFLIGWTIPYLSSFVRYEIGLA